MAEKGFMDPVARAQAEIDAMMGKAQSPAIPDTGTEGNPGTDPAPKEADRGVNADPAPSDPPADTTKTENADYWKQRFEVMQGKYNAEIPRLIEQVNTLNTQLQEVAQRGQKEDPPAQKPASVEEALSQLHDTYGSELTEALDRLVQARLKSVEDKVSNVETVTAQSAWDRFLGSLDTAAPGWRELNSDPGFLSFLDTPEEWTGAKYGALLESAYKSGDVIRTAKIFNQYKQMTGSNPQGQPDRQPTPDALATPRKRGGGDAAPSQGRADGKKVYTFAEVNKFYYDLEHGKYRGKEQEAEALEHDILVANKEGRIVG